MAEQYHPASLGTLMPDTPPIDTLNFRKFQTRNPIARWTFTNF